MSQETRQNSQNSESQATFRRHPPSLALLIGLSLLPWLWVSLGRFIWPHFGLILAFYHGMACTAPVLILARPLPRLMPPRWHWELVLAITLSVIVGNVFILGGWSLIARDTFQNQEFATYLSQIHFIPDRDFLAFTLFFIFINPVIEEYFWRGLIYPGLRQHMKPVPAILLNAFLFAIWHWLIIQPFLTVGGEIFLLLAIFLGGIFFCFFREKSDSLLPAIIVHGLGADFPLMILFYGIWQSRLEMLLLNH